MYITGLEISQNESVLIIGQSVVVNCTSAISVRELLWLNEQNTTLVNSSSDTTADLVFSPVSDSIHNKTFTCRAVQMGMVEKDINIMVSGKKKHSLCTFCEFAYDYYLFLCLLCAHSSINFDR